jgi:proteic killer suppression protein
VAHRGLRRFIEVNDPTGLSPATVDKIRNIVSFVQSMASVDELRAISAWRVHQLKGARRGEWSLTVTRNWRLTFRVEGDEIVDLNYEDYH